jgi:hypothetical protein
MSATLQGEPHNCENIGYSRPHNQVYLISTPSPLLYLTTQTPTLTRDPFPVKPRGRDGNGGGTCSEGEVVTHPAVQRKQFSPNAIFLEFTVHT